MRKVTIEDISRDTGLSRGTVSRALNDRPDISTRTKQKVLEACQRRKYVPSHAARSLATGRNYAVAVIVDDLSSTFTATVLRGVINQASSAHYAVHVTETGPTPASDYFDTFSSERIDGVINAVALGGGQSDRLRQRMEDRTLASCWPLEGVQCDVLTPDHLEAGRMAARFLIRNGKREILYIQRTFGAGCEERLTGFREVCRENGIDPDSATAVVENMSSLEPLNTRLERAQAIVANDDFLAMTLMLKCTRLGRVPGVDVSVIGYGNETAGRELSPSLTTISYNGEEIGRRIMEMLLQRLGKQRTDTPECIAVAPLLIQRDSTRGLE